MTSYQDFWGFDRTYEELKQSREKQITFRGFSFDRTYEELKPQSGLGKS